MKKLFLILISLLLLVGCAKTPASSDGVTSEGDHSGVTVVINDLSTRNDADFGQLDYDALEKLSGIDIKTTDYDYNESAMKMLAGDQNVDIYIVNGTVAYNLLQNKAYVPISSRIIDAHNDRAFDYIGDWCKTEDGQTYLMPLGFDKACVFMPQSAVTELGITADSIKYYDDYMNLLKSYKGERKSYSAALTLFYYLEEQYDHYYNDFPNEFADYNTEVYRKLYDEQVSGWVRYAQEPDSPYFLCIGKNNYSSSETLSAVYKFSDYAANCPDFYTDWRAFPIPLLSEKVEATSGGGTFMIINPSSLNKEAAVKVMETVAENYFELPGRFQGYKFLYESPEHYPKSYHPESQIFKDVLSFAGSGFVKVYESIVTSHGEVEPYQQGEITLDEAIARYQREVELWLKE